MVSSADVWDKYDSMNSTSIQIPVLPVLIVVVVIVIILIITYLKKHRKTFPEDRILTADVIDEMPLDDFIDITDEQYNQANDMGCYILYNVDKEKYYIGKGTLCADDVTRHIVGKGLPDIFYEKKDGDDFTVQFYFIADGSAYGTMQELYDDIVSIYGENSEIVEI